VRGGNAVAVELREGSLLVAASSGADGTAAAPDRSWLTLTTAPSLAGGDLVSIGATGTLTVGSLSAGGEVSAGSLVATQGIQAASLTTSGGVTSSGDVSAPNVAALSTGVDALQRQVSALLSWGFHLTSFAVQEATLTLNAGNNHEWRVCEPGTR
jgi:hypothetical protein